MANRKWRTPGSARSLAVIFHSLFRYLPTSLFANVNTLIDFDGHMRKSGEALEPLLVDRRRLRRIGNDRGDHGGVAGAELPKMQIGEAISIGLDAVANALRHRRIGNGIEKHP